MLGSHMVFKSGKVAVIIIIFANITSVSKQRIEFLHNDFILEVYIIFRIEQISFSEMTKRFDFPGENDLRQVLATDGTLVLLA